MPGNYLTQADIDAARRRRDQEMMNVCAGLIVRLVEYPEGVKDDDYSLEDATKHVNQTIATLMIINTGYTQAEATLHVAQILGRYIRIKS